MPTGCPRYSTASYRCPSARSATVAGGWCCRRAQLTRCPSSTLWSPRTRHRRWWSACCRCTHPAPRRWPAVMAVWSACIGDSTTRWVARRTWHVASERYHLQRRRAATATASAIDRLRPTSETVRDQCARRTDLHSKTCQCQCLPSSKWQMRTSFEMTLHNAAYIGTTQDVNEASEEWGRGRGHWRLFGLVSCARLSWSHSAFESTLNSS